MFLTSNCFSFGSNDCVQIRSWKSLFQEFRVKRVNKFSSHPIIEGEAIVYEKDGSIRGRADIVFKLRRSGTESRRATSENEFKIALILLPELLKCTLPYLYLDTLL